MGPLGPYRALQVPMGFFKALYGPMGPIGPKVFGSGILGTAVLGFTRNRNIPTWGQTKTQISGKYSMRV